MHVSPFYRSAGKRPLVKRVFFILMVVVVFCSLVGYVWLGWQRDDRLLSLLPSSPEMAARWQAGEDSDTDLFVAWWLTEAVTDFGYDQEKSRALWNVLLAPAERLAFGRFSAAESVPATWLALLQQDEERVQSSFLPLDQQLSSDYRGYRIYFVSSFQLGPEQQPTPLYVWQGTDGIFAVSPAQIMIEGAIDQFLAKNKPAFLTELPVPFFSRDFGALFDIDLLQQADTGPFQGTLPLPTALQQPDMQHIIFTLTAEEEQWQWEMFARYPSWWQRLIPRPQSEEPQSLVFDLDFFYDYESADFSDRFPNHIFWTVLGQYGVPGQVIGKHFSDQLAFLYVGPAGESSAGERVQAVARDFLARRYPEKQAQALPDGIITHDLVPSAQVQQQPGSGATQFFIKIFVPERSEQLWVGVIDGRLVITDSDLFLDQFLATQQAGTGVLPFGKSCSGAPATPFLFLDANVWPDMTHNWSKSHFVAWEQGETLIQGCIF